MAQKRKSPKAPSFFHDQREQDAIEVKQSSAASEIKDAHLLAKELEMRFRTARSRCATSAAQVHDMNRVVELADDVGHAARSAIKLLGG